MTTPEITHFPDGHFRKVVFGLIPYITNYPKQALLACIMQGWCPKYVLNQFFLQIITNVIADALHLETTLILVSMFITLSPILNCLLKSSS